MVNRDLTHIYIVLDRSGSMQLHKKDTQGGFDAFMAEQRKLPGHCRVTLTQFDTEYETVYRDLPLAEVPPLNLQPRGGTALLDAIGRTVLDAGHQLVTLPEADRPGAVIVLILTDGEENSSTEFELNQVKKMIEQQTNEYNWLFVYVGANQDAIKVGASMGVARGQTMTYNQANTAQTFASLATNTSTYRGATAAGLRPKEAAKLAEFTDEQRVDALGGSTE